MARSSLWEGCVAAAVAVVLWTAPSWGGIVQDELHLQPSRALFDSIDGDLLGLFRDAPTSRPPLTGLDRPEASELLTTWLATADLGRDESLLFPADSMVDRADLARALAGPPVRISTRDDRTAVDRVFDPAVAVDSAELSSGDTAGLTRVVVPEPSVLLLMLFGLPAVVHTRRRRRRTC